MKFAENNKEVSAGNRNYGGLMESLLAGHTRQKGSREEARDTQRRTSSGAVLASGRAVTVTLPTMTVYGRRRV